MISNAILRDKADENDGWGRRKGLDWCFWWWEEQEIAAVYDDEGVGILILMFAAK